MLCKKLINKGKIIRYVNNMANIKKTIGHIQLILGILLILSIFITAIYLPTKIYKDLQ